MLSYGYKKHTDNIPMEDFDMKAKFYICNHCGNLVTTIHNAGVPLVLSLIHICNGVQVVYGPKVAVIKAKLEDYLENAPKTPAATAAPAPATAPATPAAAAKDTVCLLYTSRCV